MAAESLYVTLVSSDGFRFIVDRKAAMVSGTIKAMLSGGGKFMEAGGEIKFQEISGHVLEQCVKFFYYRVCHANSTTNVPNFPIEPESALSLLMAANYLNC